MQEKELIKQLNKLENLRPDNEWKSKNREILVSQIIGGSAETEASYSFGTMFNKFVFQALRNAYQPVLITVLVVAFVVGSGFVSVQAAKDAKPGEALYIAKIISEKTQLAFTFNNKDKAKLGIEFASNRAKELTQVLADETNGKREEKVERLVKDFKTEIDGVKTRLEKISLAQKPTKEKKQTKKSEDPVKLEEDVEEDIMVFSANLGKEENGIQVSEAENATDLPKIEEPVLEKNISEDTSTVEEEGIFPTSTPEMVGAEEIQDKENPEQILKQAEELLESDDYTGTLSKLDKAHKMISNVNTDEAKDENEGATSTDANITTEEEGSDEGTTTEEGATDEIDNQQATTTTN